MMKWEDGLADFKVFYIYMWDNLSKVYIHIHIMHVMIIVHDA